MAAALRCACAVALGCLALLLLSRPEGARGRELRVSGPPEPRAAGWLSNFGQLNKYVEKLFGSSAKKPKNHKKPAIAANATSPPSTPPRKALELGPLLAPRGPG